ncbi:MAG: adenylate kinase [Bacteroidetes bacterium]|nr:adenylate kinase [Bacteroidota bacterium]MBU1719598.1 adenylate kinase [Bacteroidota bacterium]
MLNVALFGAPGAGKGTQSKHLLEKYNLMYISTGEILRQEIAENTLLGQGAKGYIERGQLVPDEIIVQIIEEKIEMNPEANGILFDGFPRTVVQAYILEGLLLKMGTSLTCMVCLDVPRETLLERLMNRALIENRADDKNKEVINHRLLEYENKTAPVAEFYREQKKYYSIDGVGEMADIFSDLETIIEEKLKEVWLNVVLIGAPGSGKGTQAKKLAQEYNLVYISTGEMIRNEVAAKTESGIRAKPYIDRGDIVPDEIAIRLIESKIKKSPKARGFIFKGFPSTIVQAYILDGLLRKMQSSVSLVLDISVPTLQSVKRLSDRAKTPKRRFYDMNLETIIHRLEVFERHTALASEFYKKQGKLISVSGEGAENDVFKRLCDHIERAFRKIH